MSIENAERYFQELEAIKNYSQVKQDKEKLSQENEERKVSLNSALITRRAEFHGLCPWVNGKAAI